MRFLRRVAHGTCPVAARGRLTVKRSLCVRTGQNVMVILNGGVAGLRCVVIGNAILIGKVVDNGCVGVSRASIEKLRCVVGEQSTQSIIPRTGTNSVNCVYLFAVAIVRRAQKRSPSLAVARSTRLGNCGTNVICATKSSRRARFTVAQISAEAFGAAIERLRQRKQPGLARHEETKFQR